MEQPWKNNNKEKMTNNCMYLVSSSKSNDPSSTATGNTEKHRTNQIQKISIRPKLPNPNLSVLLTPHHKLAPSFFQSIFLALIPVNSLAFPITTSFSSSV